MTGFDPLLDLVTPETRWKYLRENSTRFFDPKRNTPLSEYLETVFPSSNWVYDKMIDSEIQKARGSRNIRKFRPDARCEELSLIVEFDGVPHYQKIASLIEDPKRDEYLKSLGYRVVRIPYFIQLSNINISHLFGVSVKAPMCELNYSFFDTGNKLYGLDIAPGSMCGLGVERFVKEFESFPAETREAIVRDLLKVANPEPFGSSRPLDWVVPKKYQNTIFGSVNDVLGSS